MLRLLKKQTQLLTYVITEIRLIILKFFVALTNGSTRTIFSMRKKPRIEKITC